MDQKFFRRAWLFRLALLFGFLTFIPFNSLSLSECSGLILSIRLIQDPLILLRGIFAVLLTALAVWRTHSKPFDARPLNFVLRYVAVPLFVAYGILALYISNTLCYSNVISNQLVSTYVDGWLSEITNSFLLGLFLGIIYGLTIPVLRQVLIFGYSQLVWVISGENPKVYKIHVQSHHNNSLFLARASLLGLLMPLVLSFTNPIYQEVTQSPPNIILYFFNSYLQVSLFTIPFLVALGESLTLTFDCKRRLSDVYFRWLFAALSIGAVANFVLSQLSKLGFDLNGVEYLAKPVASTFLMFVGASVALAFSLEIGERYITRKRIFAGISVLGMLFSVLFLVETDVGYLLNSSFFGKPPNPLLVSWYEMIFVSEPLLPVSTYLGVSTFVYLLSFLVMVLFYYRASLPSLKLSKIVPSLLLAALSFTYQWPSPSGSSATTWRSLLSAVIMGLLAYCYVPVMD